MSDFTFLNPDTVKHTGFHGWLNVETREVLFCSRVYHLDMIEKGRLAGVDPELVYEPASAGGPEGSSWSDIKRWAAERNWVHFIHNPDADYLMFSGLSEAQEHTCRAFADAAGIPAVIPNVWGKS